MGGAPSCSAQSFVCGGPNFDANRNKLLLSDQVLHCLQRTLEVNHPGSRLRSNHLNDQDYLGRVCKSSM
jgi:hypothetical protein